MIDREAIEDAYAMGVEVGKISTDSAQYANSVLPKLRQMAGFEDPTGAGTYSSAPDDEAFFDYGSLVEVFWKGTQKTEYEIEELVEGHT